MPDENNLVTVSWPHAGTFEHIFYEPSASESVIEAHHWRYKAYPGLVVSIVGGAVYDIASWTDIPLPGAEHAAAEKARRAAAEAKRQAEKEHKAAVEAAKWRTWSDASGKHEIKAKYSGAISGKVKLVKEDGSAVWIPLEKLSDEDQKWIANPPK